MWGNTHLNKFYKVLDQTLLHTWPNIIDRSSEIRGFDNDGFPKCAGTIRMIKHSILHVADNIILQQLYMGVYGLISTTLQQQFLNVYTSWKYCDQGMILYWKLHRRRQLRIRNIRWNFIISKYFWVSHKVRPFQDSAFTRKFRGVGRSPLDVLLNYLYQIR